MLIALKGVVWHKSPRFPGFGTYNSGLSSATRNDGRGRGCRLKEQWEDRRRRHKKLWKLKQTKAQETIGKEGDKDEGTRNNGKIRRRGARNNGKERDEGTRNNRKIRRRRHKKQ